MSALAATKVEIEPGKVRGGRISLPDPFRLTSGDTLLGSEVPYQLYGPPNAPLVVALGGISATREVAAVSPDGPLGWWQGMVGPGLPVDTTRFRVLGIDWLGKEPVRFRPDPCQGDLGPSTSQKTRPYPVISTRDQARALRCVLEEIGPDPIHTFLGSSYGGMVGLAFAAEYPGQLERLVVISGAHRTHPMATAHRVVQRRIVELGLANGSGPAGLALSRALAMTTYRSIDEFEHRFAAPAAASEGDHRFEVEEYLLAQGEKFCRRFTPEAFLCLSLSIDIHHVQPCSVGTPVDLISVDSDTLVPPWLMTELEEELAGPCRHHRISSLFGHDAFLKETGAIGGRLERILDRKEIVT